MTFSQIGRWALALPAVAALLMIPGPASAQETGVYPTPLVEMSTGYTFMRDFSEADDLMPTDPELEDVRVRLTAKDHVDFPAGWYLSTAFNVRPWLGLVGEGTGSYKNGFDVGVSLPDLPGVPDFVVANDVRVYTVMGGPRVFYQTGRFVPYAQVLLGAAHLRIKSRFPSEIPVDPITDSVTDFAVQPGGGLTVFLTDRIGVRVAADYRRIIDFGDDVASNEFRVLSGLTFNWGRR